MACDVIKKEGIAHLHPLSLRIYHASLPPPLCLRRANLYAAFQLDFLRMWPHCLLERLCLCAASSSSIAAEDLKQPGKGCCAAPSSVTSAGARLL